MLRPDRQEKPAELQRMPKGIHFVFASLSRLPDCNRRFLFFVSLKWMRLLMLLSLFLGALLPRSFVLTDPDSCGADPEVRSEASWAVLNATSCGSDHQVTW